MTNILYPPYPDCKITKGQLEKYEKTGNWMAQRKFNGTHVLIRISKEKKVSMLTRHGTAPKIFKLKKTHVDQILSLNLKENKEYWLNGELLDHKTKNKKYKGKIVFFDILQEGQYLIKKLNQTERVKLLSEICHNSVIKEPNEGIAIAVTEDVWMAESWENDFRKHYEEYLHLDEVEGLILRKKNSFIDNFGQKKHKVSWMIKVRKPHSGGLYAF